MNIELYIADKLCDLGGSDLAITLKRQFLNPTELNTKDAQKSYSISLPATTANNEIFGYRNVEEVGDKFKIYPSARLYVGGVLLLDGKFMLTEITRDGYKGNLGVPKRKEVKDVFGHSKMNEVKPWTINDFKGLETISEYNQKENAECIFPLVLYGLLPKVEQARGGYTDKDLLDIYVKLGIDDFPPSVNCIQMLKHIFSSSGYNLTGSALADERINSLYVSYRNPNDYQLDWGANDISLTGMWSFYDSEKYNKLERNYTTADNSQLSVNLFKAINNSIEIISDIGGSISQQGVRRGGTSILIPYSGLYKIDFRCDTLIQDNTVYPNYYKDVGVLAGDLDTSPMEIHLVRNIDKNKELRFNNKFSYDNIAQDIGNEDTKYPRSGKVNFIDPKQDKSFLCGFSFGKNDDDNYKNPLNPSNCNPMAIKGGRSWDFDGGEGVIDRAYSAVDSPSYMLTNGEDTEIFRVELQNSNTSSIKHNEKLASGEINQVVWLEKGDRLDIVFTTQRRSQGLRLFISDYNISYKLNIYPFQHERNWLKMNEDGSSSEPMDWRAPSSFTRGQIDLVKFLPSEIKINDWIENFCKAFNLDLHDTGDGFSLDLKDRGTVRNTSIIINLDERASVEQSINQPINAPYSYELGFTIDVDEEGYYSSQDFDANDNPIPDTGDTGGGEFIANEFGGSSITQSSNFSYCWYKKIYTWKEEEEEEYIMLPVITDKEVWIENYDYEEMMRKLYFDKAQRFWYKSGTNNIYINDNKFTNALVSNEYNGLRPQILDYEDKPNSLMSNLFILLKNDKSYTVVECYLTPQEYSDLDISLVRFNGDLYNIAEIDGYDPLGRRKCTLKLIRKI